MRRSLVSRLFLGALIGVVSAGGGNLPLVDGLFFHRGAPAEAPAQAHFEVAAECHADQCAIVSPVQQHRLAPRLMAASIRLVPDLADPAPLSRVVPGAAPTLTQPFSRAPPFLS